jgi:hypothetical protein
MREETGRTVLHSPKLIWTLLEARGAQTPTRAPHAHKERTSLPRETAHAPRGAVTLVYDHKRAINRVSVSRCGQALYAVPLI